jgi:hypothetical protein
MGRKKDTQHSHRSKYMSNRDLYVLIMLSQIPDVPFRIFGAKAKDGFRKPMPGIWYELERIFNEDGVQIGLLHLTPGLLWGY